jgi:hypothetical protein
MPYTLSRTRLLPVLAMLLLASGCASAVTLPPPADDLKAVVEPKPVPGDDIATSDQANADYEASLEGWGDRISAAGGRLCRWTVRVYKVKVDCPKD